MKIEFLDPGLFVWRLAALACSAAQALPAGFRFALPEASVVEGFESAGIGSEPAA